MSNYSGLKQDINNNIYENQTQQITGTVLNAILNEMTASLGAGYQFAGVATLGMNPGDPDQRVFYLAGEGIYTNFGGLQVPQGKLGVLKWDFRWTLQTIDGLGGGGANLTGYVSVASTDDLPDEGQPTLGYLCGTNLYLYVGTGGDTKEGKYQNCGSFRGPQGLQGDPGVGIATVTQTTTSTEDEGINVITVTRNGSKGSQGIQGPQGVQGEPGRLQAQYKEVETLPTASADTVDYIYLVASQTPNTYDMYYTEENQGAYSWKSLGTTAVQLSDYATKAEVNQLEAKVTDIREYGTLTKYPSGNNWTGISQTIAKYIKVKEGDVVYIKGNETRNAYIAFVNSIDTSVAPSYSNGTTSPKTSVSEETIDVVSDCYLVWVVQYNNTTVFDPNILTLNGENILESTYNKSKFDTFEQEVAIIEQNIEEVEQEVAIINGKIDVEREYGTLPKYINSINTWSTGSSFISKYIAVEPGDTIHIVKNSTRNAYCAFIESPDTTINPPVFKNGFNGVRSDVTDQEYTVTERCYFWWLCEYSASEVYTPSILTLNEEDIRTDTYSYNRFDALQDEIDAMGQSVANAVQVASEAEQTVEILEETVNSLIEEDVPAVYAEEDFTLDGYYNNANDGRTSGYGYTSIPLINVREGMTIYWHKWSQNTALEVAGAVWCYDNDGLPYNGNNARILYGNLTTKDYVNGEFSLVIPSGCSQIGISATFGTYPVQDGANIQIGDLEISFTKLIPPSEKIRIFHLILSKLNLKSILFFI